MQQRSAMRTEMMALKALISRKWKLDNCSAEGARKGQIGKFFWKIAETESNITFEILFVIDYASNKGSTPKHIEN